jgi:hypothetical protein
LIRYEDIAAAGNEVRVMDEGCRLHPESEWFPVMLDAALAIYKGLVNEWQAQLQSRPGDGYHTIG